MRIFLPEEKINMAADTDRNLRNQVMYSVFVRQYSKEGTFDKVKEDIPRIRSLGTDIVWLMPIHPIGEVNRKGTLGSPYAIRDYRAVNPEYGTMEDFRALVDEIHANGMKCIIDVVYNHTSPDSVLSKEHPEWFYHKPDGSFGNRIGDWTDIIDLDYSKKELWAYQIDTLKMWAETVDGFRCDVAPLVPLEFWLQARRAVAEVRPGAIWLSETVEPPFICDLPCKRADLSFGFRNVPGIRYYL
jgi:glycosidase